jgi:hypothetical protein
MEWKSTMAILISLLSIFAAGFTCGYFVRDRKSKKGFNREVKSTRDHKLPGSAFGQPRRAF